MTQSPSDSHGATVGSRALADFTSAIFRAAGMPAAYADSEADMLVWANVRGIDSHGVLRIPWYIQQIDDGDMVPDAVPEIVRQTAATALIDAHRAPGPVATMAGVEHAVAKARTCGAAWVVIRSCTHNGALAYYTDRIAREGLIGMTTVCSPPNMAPYGAKAAGLHNSPISIGIPARRHPPIVLDMATSVAAGGKIYFAADQGIPIPKGWALDKDGNDTTDPTKAKIWLPLGPKGSGLAMMFECWSSLLAGNPLCVPRMADPTSQSQAQNAVVMAVDVAAFIDPDEYRRSVDELIDAIKALPPSGPEPIMVPGERENVIGDERARAGVSLPHGTMRRIDAVAKRFGIAAPW
jgi:LDH2 family malate/lactate/ureidoglycolate dehydrogenase